MLQEKITAIAPFETGLQLFSRLSFFARPKEHLTVHEWAVRNMKHYDPHALPFLAEIMDACSDPETSEVGDMGPAQGGKSMIGEAWLGWSIDQEPSPFLMVQPDKAAAEAFVKLRINELINNVPAIKRALLPDSSANNLHLKMFKGMYFGAAWPVKAQIRQRPYQNVWADDFDAVDDDIEGEGNLITLMDGRQTTFEGRDTKLVSSSPAKEKAGIEAFIEGGTDERLQPVCPSCDERIELDIKRDLKFTHGAPDDAAATAHVICPANGCILEPAAKRQLLDSMAFLPNRGFVAKNDQASKFRRTFRRDGLLAFTSWPKLARKWREAQIAWESRQDEGELRSFFNVKGGQNYRSQLSGEKPVKASDLRSRREEGWAMGTVPRGPKVLNITIDVQQDRFELSCLGTAAGRETWFIDRFAIHVLDDGLTGVQPFTHKEHWKVLLPLFDRKFPLAALDEKGKPVGHAPVLSVTVDTGGSGRKGDQATEGAKYFYQAAVALGVHPSRITLVKGGSSLAAKIMPAGQFADQRTRGGAKRRSARLWIPNVHKIKNIIDARLRRAKPGPGYVHFPEDFSDEHFDELTSEEMVDGKWKQIRARNETLDLLVYGEAALLKPPFAQSQNHMRWIPRGYSIVWPKLTAEPVAKEEEISALAAPAVDEDKAQTAKPSRRARKPRRKKGWMTGHKRNF